MALSSTDTDRLTWHRLGAAAFSDLIYVGYLGTIQMATITPHGGFFNLNVPIDADRDHSLQLNSLKQAKREAAQILNIPD